MISDRDRRILAETERQMRLENPELGRRFETATVGGVPRWLLIRLVRAATSIPMMTALLLLVVGSMVLGLGISTLMFVAMATTSIWFRIRRERDD